MEHRPCLAVRLRGGHAYGIQNGAKCPLAPPSPPVPLHKEAVPRERSDLRAIPGYLRPAGIAETRRAQEPITATRKKFVSP